MKTVMRTWNNMQYMPQPMPPKSISPIRMFHIGIMPASGIQLSCMELTEPLSIAVQEVPQSTLFITPMRCSLPSMFASALPVTGLGCDSKYHAPANESKYSASMTLNKAPGVLLVADQQAEHIDLRHRHDDDRQHFQEVRQRRRILERMRAVHVVPAAAVGEELLDGLERTPPARPEWAGCPLSHPP